MSRHESPPQEEPIRFFGKEVGNLEREEVESMVVPPETVMHVTRHLQAVSPEAKQRLLDLTVSGEQVDETAIQNVLEAAGSKFHPKIQDPEAVIATTRSLVIEELGSGANVQWRREEKTGEEEAQIAFDVTKEAKASPGLSVEEQFGTHSVIPVTPEITPMVKKELRGKGEERDRLEVNTISDIPIPMTDHLIVVLKRTAGATPRLHTVYTGMLAPSLPRKEEQSDEEFAYNTEWWERHAFIR